MDVDGAKVARSWGVVRWWDFISCVGFSVEGLGFGGKRTESQNELKVEGMVGCANMAGGKVWVVRVSVSGELSCIVM